MSTPEALTLMIALQFGLYGLGWLGASVFIAQSRPALRLFCGFALVAGLGLMLIALRGRLPDGLSYLGAGICLLSAYAMLSVGASLLLGLPVSRWQQLGLPALGVLLLVALWFNGRHDAWRISVLNLTIAGIVLRATFVCFRPLRAEFGWLAAALPAVAGALLVADLLRRQAGALLAWDASLLQLGTVSAVNEASLFVLLFCAAAINFAIGGAVLTRVVRRLDHLSRHDALTALLNRRAWMELAAHEWQRQRRYGGSFAVVTFDIDHFKRINDRLGHAMGDHVLARLGRVIAPVLRGTDRLGRIGGEEFAVLLLGADEPTALRLAERMRAAVAGEGWAAELLSAGGVTVSVGVAVCSADDADVAALLARADSALYRAKGEGRNRVQAAAPAPPPTFSPAHATPTLS